MLEEKVTYAGNHKQVYEYIKATDIRMYNTRYIYIQIPDTHAECISHACVIIQ